MVKAGPLIFRASLRQIEDSDGKFLLSQLEKQEEEQSEYPLTDKDRRQLTKVFRVRTPSGEISVDVPEDEYEDGHGDANTDAEDATSESRQSHLVQARIAKIGIEMGFKIWVPRNDKTRVLDHISDDKKSSFLDVLPINYDDTTLRTIEQIDVIWLKGRSMARAFEVEHTTAVYSGLLRMADLLALQPNMDIQLHIVAPDEKRGKVLREIRRPVFSLLERGPLYEKCTFLSYSSIESLGDTSHLAHMNDSIIEEYEEWARGLIKPYTSRATDARRIRIETIYNFEAESGRRASITSKLTTSPFCSRKAATLSGSCRCLSSHFLPSRYLIARNHPTFTSSLFI